MKISAIVINWNQPGYTIKCIRSLLKANPREKRIFIVDNGSSDGSIRQIGSFLGKHHLNYDIVDENNLDSDKDIVLIKASSNKGFAAGNNLALKHIVDNKISRYVFFLNNDAVVNEDTLTILMDSMNPNTGIAGPVIYDLNSDRVQSAGMTIDLKSCSIKHNKNPVSGSFDAIVGSAMLARTDLFKKIGYFDEKYFMYWEEIDLCFRAKNSGYKNIVIPKAKVWHKLGVSAGRCFEVEHMARNRLLFMKKYSKKIDVIICILKTPYTIIRNSLYFSRHRHQELIWPFIKGSIRGIFS